MSTKVKLKDYYRDIVGEKMQKLSENMKEVMEEESKFQTRNALHKKYYETLLKVRDTIATGEEISNALLDEFLKLIVMLFPRDVVGQPLTIGKEGVYWNNTLFIDFEDIDINREELEQALKNTDGGPIFKELLRESVLVIQGSPEYHTTRQIEETRTRIVTGMVRQLQEEFGRALNPKEVQKVAEILKDVEAAPTEGQRDVYEQVKEALETEEK